MCGCRVIRNECVLIQYLISVLSPICDKRADLVANVSASAPPFLDEVGAYETGAKAKNAIVEPSISGNLYN